LVSISKEESVQIAKEMTAALNVVLERHNVESVAPCMVEGIEIVMFVKGDECIEHRLGAVSLQTIVEHWLEEGISKHKAVVVIPIG
jgi:predicted transcriptional regulator